VARALTRRRESSPRALAALLGTMAVVLAGPATASALQRYAGPNGGASPTCPRATPCDLRTAIELAPANAEVIVLHGDYGSAGAPLSGEIANPNSPLTVHGEVGRPRPRIFVSPANAVSALRLTQATVRHLEVQARPTSGGFHQPAFTIDNGQAADIVARSFAANARGCVVLHTSVLTDSLCEAISPVGDIFGVATFLGVGPGEANNSVVRNVTAIARFGPGVQSSGGAGIVAFAGAGAAGDQHLTVSNTIARGPQTIDLRVDDPDGPTSGGMAEITIDHSHFGFESYEAMYPKPIHELGGNQARLAVQPRFVAAGNYHQAAGSITIDAGADTPLDGPVDFDGDPRLLGAHTDIGADEFAPPPLATTLAATGVTRSSARLHGTVNPRRLPTTYRFQYGRTRSYGASTPIANAGAGGANVAAARTITGLAPNATFHFRIVAINRGGSAPGLDRTFRTRATRARLLSLKVKPRAFRATAGRGGSVRPARAAGTKVTFRLSRAAKARFTVHRIRAGGRARRVRGGFSVRGRAGSHRFRFTGRIKGHALKPGRYRLTGRAPANRRRVRFTIVRR
jgi:hypothetical protein